jgi:hypothetical protein
MISGKVLDEKGFAAANVSVAFFNKSNSIITNPDGTFKIMAKKLPDTLVFSAPGYENYKVVVTEKTVKDIKFEVVLLNKRESLDEVVVTSSVYRTVRKEMGYSTTKIGSDELSGKVSGVSVSPGAATSVKIRGASSIPEARRDMSAGYSMSSTGKKTIFTDSLKKEEGKTYRTRLLTAGELNDFAKWKMWEDFTQNEFDVWATAWQLRPKQRYCVLVLNEQQFALTNKEVYLLDAATNDTVWKAVTDNTGKAELWANALGKETNSKDYVIICKGAEEKLSAMPFESGVNRLRIKANCAASKTVDIAFVVDATGSMGDEIEYLKLELEDVLNQTFGHYSNLDLNAGAVFYRDKGDAYLTKHTDFNTDLLKTLNFIKLQKADGGGDAPEAVNDAMRTALDSLHWSQDARARILFLVLDAPPHSNAVEEMYLLTQKAAAMGIRIVPIVCSGADKSTEFLMRSMALLTNGTYLFLSDNNAGVGGTHLKPTTDVYAVELLNNLLPRIIQQMLYTSNCADANEQQPIIKQPNNIVEVKVSPNPTKGIVNIKGNKAIKEIFVADFAGKILMRLADGKKNQWQVDLSSYPAGTYIIKYVTAENEWGSERVVLMK